MLSFKTGHELTRPRAHRGFALVITLSLMVLLAILALGMLSLSAISLRASSRSAAQADARANARVALMLAIGELQKNAGPDTRITAPSGIVDEYSAPLTGVWKSWEGTDHETTGRPVQPSYGDKKRKETDGGRFLGWLVSGNASDPENPAALASGSPTTNTIPLLAAGTLGAGGDGQVHVVPQPAEGSGTYAWWVTGENQKARLPRHYEPENQTAAGWADLAKSHAVADPEPFGLDQDLLVAPSPADKAITLPTANLLAVNAAKPPREYFHDLSVSSVGLLTNTATGGWRKDLSLVSESWERQPLRGLPFFRISPLEESEASIPTTADPMPAGGMIYPWAQYPGSTGGSPISRTGACSSWANLFDHMTHYKRVSVGAGGRATTALHSEHIFNNQKVYSYHHKVRVLPVIARIQWVFSHGAAPLSVAQGEDPLFEPRLHLTPVVTMWNPYNVGITSPPRLDFLIPITLPSAFRHHIDGQANPVFKSLTTAVNHQPPLSATGNSQIDFRLSIPSSFAMMPGETRLFSPASSTPVAHSLSMLNLTPGYRPGGGILLPGEGCAGAVPAETSGYRPDQGGRPFRYRGSLRR